MTDNVTPDTAVPMAAATGIETKQLNPRVNTGSNTTRRDNRFNGTSYNTSRDFEGATTKLGGLLGLRSENVTKKVGYDAFCEKIGIYSMTEFRESRM